MTVLAERRLAPAATAPPFRPYRPQSPMRLAAAGDALPDPRPLTRRLAQAIAEVLAGARPASQLSSHATLPVIRMLERNTGRLGGVGMPQHRPIIGSVHVAEPCEGVVEACAVIDIGGRVRALALRLDAANGQWRCTAVRMG
jgi:hypothetical protein